MWDKQCELWRVSGWSIVAFLRARGRRYRWVGLDQVTGTFQGRKQYKARKRGGELCNSFGELTYLAEALGDGEGIVENKVGWNQTLESPE